MHLDLNTLIQRNLMGEQAGLPCFCTANEYVLKAVISFAARHDLPVCIEATCNQVNQYGGYTGLTPKMYQEWVLSLAKAHGFSRHKIILGGDHLGPNPWKSLPADIAMNKAKQLIKDYVEAGFSKIHIDASMKCGEEKNLTYQEIAKRSAELCAVAEKYAPDTTKLIYIIGTEVPIPGGEIEELTALDVTSTLSLDRTIYSHKMAWKSYGITNSWKRIAAVVAQPGVDFGHSNIFKFQPDKSQKLSAHLRSYGDLVFEAHSTDYQSNQALYDLVKQHFMFLKVGPELTFRLREAIFTIAKIYAELTGSSPGDFEKFIDQKMVENPKHWKSYYCGTAIQQQHLRKFSYSDRIRYYWAHPEIASRLESLVNSKILQEIPEIVAAQYFMGYEFGKTPTTSLDLIQDHIIRCISRYYRAAGRL